VSLALQEIDVHRLAAPPRLRLTPPSHWRSRRVALTVPVGDRRAHEILRGVFDWASGHGAWALATFAGPTHRGSQLIGWQGDGVILAAGAEADARAAAELGVPGVIVANAGAPRMAVGHAPRAAGLLALLGGGDQPALRHQAISTSDGGSSASDAWRIGYDAAALLDDLMEGEWAADVREPVVQPAWLVKRPATDVASVEGESESVATAVEFVRSHISDVFGVEALLRVTGAPRRSLELDFKRSMRCTPYQFITRERVARAKGLLAAPNRLKLSAIAAACGFSDLRRFRLVFRRETGISPADYRAGEGR
jgi:AraC-like DNA-binding protein